MAQKRNIAGGVAELGKLVEFWKSRNVGEIGNVAKIGDPMEFTASPPTSGAFERWARSQRSENVRGSARWGGRGIGGFWDVG